MYVPRSFAMNEEECIAFIRHNTFASITTSNPLQATHVPLLTIGDTSPDWVLEGHVAKANPHHKAFNNAEVLCIFNGPHAYISGSTYAKGPAVPTWNYVSVHVNGEIKSLPAEDNMAIVRRMLIHYEGENANNQDVYCPDYIAKLSKAIVSFRIVVKSITGTKKLGQNKSAEDQARIHSNLNSSEAFDVQSLASYMKTVLNL